MKTYIGLDPGSTGGIACIRSSGMFDVIKMPKTAEEIYRALKSFVGSNAVFILEDVHSSPQQGVSTAFKFGYNFGILHGMLAPAPFPYYLVTPQKWQAALNCRTGGDKQVSYDRARELFPNAGKKINKQTAESLLLAYYGYHKGL